MAALRGRAAQPLRPGVITKAVLSGDIPLVTGEFVKEASITDIHSVYKYLTKQENMVRPKDKRIRGMTYASFVTMFRFAKCLGLVEKVREEPMLFPPPNATLLSIRKPEDEPHVVESKRSIYRLTQAGIEDELAWTNLRRAWGERWPVPQKAIEAVPEVPVIKPKPAPPRKVIERPKRPKLSSTPSVTQFKKLLKFLKELRDSGLKQDEILKEMYDISGITADWTVWIEDALQVAKTASQKAKLTSWNEHISEVTDAFVDEDIDAVISSLEKLIRANGQKSQ